jgi:Redoxin
MLRVSWHRQKETRRALFANQIDGRHSRGADGARCRVDARSSKAMSAPYGKVTSAVGLLLGMLVTGNSWFCSRLASAEKPAVWPEKSTVTVPDKGEMPKLEVVANPRLHGASRRREPGNSMDYRVRVIDEQGEPLATCEARTSSADHGSSDWRTGRDGLVMPSRLFGADMVDVLVRADGYASSIARMAGPDFERLQRGDAVVTMRPGVAAQLRFRLPRGRRWPDGVLPEVYFGELLDRARFRRSYSGGRREPLPDFNILNIRPVGPGSFELRLAKETPPFYVAIHSPGFLQYFEAGPFSLADVKNGAIDIDVPQPASLSVRFDAPAEEAGKLPFKGVSLAVRIRIPGSEVYLDVLSEQSNSVSHELRLNDLAPGDYEAEVRTQSKTPRKQGPRAEINPGAYFDRKQLRLKAGQSERVAFRYAPFDPNAFRGSRSAVLRIRRRDGKPATDKLLTVDYSDGHYGQLSVFSGRLPQSGEVTLEGLTDRRPPNRPLGPFSVSVENKWVGNFAFTTDAPKPSFDFWLAPEAGDLAPDVQLLQIATGKTIALSSLRGKVVLLEFWATWCGACHPAMEETNRLAAKHKATWKDRICLLPVSIDDNADQVKEHAAQRAWDGLDHCWSGSGANLGFECPAARAFVVFGVPESILIDRDGRILWRGRPMSKRDGKDLRSRIEAALSP